MNRENWRKRAMQAEERVIVLQKLVIEYADKLIELQRPRVTPKFDSPEEVAELLKPLSGEGLKGKDDE